MAVRIDQQHPQHLAPLEAPRTCCAIVKDIIMRVIEAVKDLFRRIFCLTQTAPVPVAQNLLISNTNQFQAGGAHASLCTSCAVTFLHAMKGNAPLSIATIDQSIANGRQVHERVTRATNSPANTNFNAQQVIQHGELNLRELLPSLSSRPKDGTNLSQHYQARITPAFFLPAHRQGNLTCAVFTKAPYSSAIAYQHNEKRFHFYDSHGEQETENKAFVRTFDTSKGLCDYLAKRYGYIDFPDVDFDLETGQDNPNCYELTFV